MITLLAIVGSRGEAQQMPVKRALSAASTLPCAAPAPGLTASRNDSPDVRRLMALGHEAAIVGDSRQARDAFVDAAKLSPGDERIAYQLGRAYEELGERPNAVREYCRFLALAPQSGDAADVRARITTLTAPTGSNPGGDPASAAFKAGVNHLDQRRWREAADSFGRVIQTLPRAAEAYYDRGLAHAALDQRDDAVRDFEQYLAMRPTAEDQAQVRAQIDALRRPTWSANTALLTGLLVPGLGQVYTSRPWIGVGVAAAAGTALYLALYSKEEQEIRDFSVTIPGFPPIPNLDTVTVTKHPYQAAGIAMFATLTIGAAFEAARYARRSRAPVIKTEPRPAARVGALELFAPDVVPARRGLAVRWTGRISLPQPGS
ncbi:MAG TPA: tetratricopeptide repeat protein [Gemmatimonadaceae bacterium]|nr:tetratricopeptide repeat protein [Gemmatimonadaceae bacterium]